MIRDHSDHGRWNEPMNPLWTRIHRFIWFIMNQVILDHWSSSGSSQRKAPLMRPPHFVHEIKTKWLWRCVLYYEGSVKRYVFPPRQRQWIYRRWVASWKEVNGKCRLYSRTTILRDLRELSQRRRKRQRELQKAKALNKQNSNNSARAARNFCTFPCRHCTTSNWNSLTERLMGT